MTRRGYVDAAYLAAVSRSTSSFKVLTYELMHLRPGAVVLDVGCGSGEDTLELSKLVGARGRVFGVDYDEGLLRVANRRARSAKAKNLKHQKAVLPELPFQTAFFDAVRSERVFQHLTKPRESLLECARVTRPGGRVVLLEPDWGSLVVDAGDTKLERRVLDTGVDLAVNNGTAGRRLLGDFVRAGLRDLDVRIFPMRYTSLEAADHFILSGVEEAAAPKVGSKTLGRWRKALEAAEAAGAFFATFNYVVVAGSREVAKEPARRI